MQKTNKSYEFVPYYSSTDDEPSWYELHDLTTWNYKFMSSVPDTIYRFTIRRNVF